MASENRVSISLKRATKDGLDKNRAPGQCYDGFICQLIDLWEKAKEEELSRDNMLKGVMPRV
jgi:hypothetical protein